MENKVGRQGTEETALTTASVVATVIPATIVEVSGGGGDAVVMAPVPISSVQGGDAGEIKTVVHIGAGYRQTSWNVTRSDRGGRGEVLVGLDW